MWEWLMQKVTEIVRMKYKDNNIRSMQRDDVIQEIMMYLFEDKTLAEKIYKEKKIGLLYCISKNVMFDLNSKDVFKSKAERSRYLYVQKICVDWDVEPVPENAYKIVAIIRHDPNISAVSKKKVYTIAAVKELLEITEQFITECELIEN